MQYARRKFLISSAAAGAVSALWSLSAFANYPKQAFTMTELQKTLAELLQGQVAADSGVMLKVPAIAENGAQVRVEVQTDLPKVETISLLVEKNPVPLTSQFMMSEHSKPKVQVNLKVRETSQVIAVVKADGKFYRASKEVRVTAGGCG